MICIGEKDNDYHYVFDIVVDWQSVLKGGNIMNGRAPAYKKCNEVTLVKEVDGRWKFYTFWKNVHQQFLISSGYINGCTYEVGEPILVTKEEGNKFYISCKKSGWVKMQEFFRNNPIILQSMPTILW